MACSGCGDDDHRLESCDTPKDDGAQQRLTRRRRGQAYDEPPPVDRNDPEVRADAAVHRLLASDRPRVYADCLTADQLRTNPGWRAEHDRRQALRLPIVQAEDGVNCARPCPWVSCRHHLYLEVNPATGKIGLAFPTMEVWDLKETCALDVVRKYERGAPLHDVADASGVTHQRIQQIEARGILHLQRAVKRNPGMLELPDYDHHRSIGQQLEDDAPGEY